MGKINPVRPSLKQLIADNTIQFNPNGPIELINSDFDHVVAKLREISNDDWYLQGNDIDENHHIVKNYLRLKSHQLVNLSLTRDGTIFTVFMRNETAKDYANLIVQVINECLSARKSQN